MDPISNVLTSLRNGQTANKSFVSVPFSNMAWILSKVLFQHGCIAGMGVRHTPPAFRRHRGCKPTPHTTRIVMTLHHALHEQRKMRVLRRVSSPKKRVYMPYHVLKQTMPPFGFRILSTPQGVMTDGQALFRRVGGEVLCAIT